MPRLHSVCSSCDVCESAVWEITRLLHTNCPFWEYSKKKWGGTFESAGRGGWQTVWSLAYSGSLTFVEELCLLSWYYKFFFATMAEFFVLGKDIEWDLLLETVSHQWQGHWCQQEYWHWEQLWWRFCHCRLCRWEQNSVAGCAGGNQIHMWWRP